MPPNETKDFRRGYQLAVMDTQRQINLRYMEVPVERNKDVGNRASTSKPKNDMPPSDSSKNLLDTKGKERREKNMRNVD